jgi:hypothetical protein
MPEIDSALSLRTHMLLVHPVSASRCPIIPLYIFNNLSFCDEKHSTCNFLSEAVVMQYTIDENARVGSDIVSALSKRTLEMYHVLELNFFLLFSS